MEDTNKPLTGQIALVTGGSRGIGKQIAIDLAKLGAYIAINYNNNKQSAELVKNEIINSDVKKIKIPANIIKPEPNINAFPYTSFTLKCNLAP